MNFSTASAAPAAPVAATAAPATPAAAPAGTSSMPQFVALELPNAVAHVDVSVSERALYAIIDAYDAPSYDAALAILNRIAADECLTLTEVTNPVTFGTLVIIMRQ